MTQKEGTTPSGEDWKEVAFSLVTNAVKQSSANIIQTVHDRIDSAVHAVIKRIVIVFLALLGVALLLIGGAQYIGTLLGMAAYGYLFIGAVTLLVAGLMRFASRT